MLQLLNDYILKVIILHKTFKEKWIKLYDTKINLAKQTILGWTNEKYIEYKKSTNNNLKSIMEGKCLDKFNPRIVKIQQKIGFASTYRTMVLC